MGDTDDERPDEIDRLFQALKSVNPPRGFSRVTVESSRAARQQRATAHRPGAILDRAGTDLLVIMFDERTAR